VLSNRYAITRGWGAWHAVPLLTRKGKPLCYDQSQGNKRKLCGGFSRAPAQLPMPDLLVNLLKLPALETLTLELQTAGVTVRRAQPFEVTPVRSFVAKSFSVAWADEVSIAFAAKPIPLFIAIAANEIVGFAAYECTRRGFFGPTGVRESMRGKGLGTALLLHSLWGLRELGYVYGIIGAAGPVEFYQRLVGAIVIPDSDPGIYTNLLK
jgi:GNAT superfamily N-acetyltransferase